MSRSVLAIGVILWCVTAAARAEAGPLAQSEYVAVDDARLYLETRGADRSAPVVLWLHGGPGGAERPLFRYFDGALENDFVVAYLDQRGAGRSFDPAADPRRLTVARQVDDVAAVVAHLRRMFGRDRVVLLGHSWGAELALLHAHAHPHDVALVIGVNPVVSVRRAQWAQWAFVEAEALRRGDEATQRRLAALGPPPHASAAALLAVDDVADRYGALFHRRPNRLTTVVLGIFRGLVTPWEIPSFIRANRVSLDAMTPELLALDLADAVPRVDVPVAFFVGRWDRHVDAASAADYLDRLRAPAKELVWFETSAHNVPFEEPERFVAAVRRVAAGALP
jgi:proline iminopeptidase